MSYFANFGLKTKLWQNKTAFFFFYWIYLDNWIWIWILLNLNLLMIMLLASAAAVAATLVASSQPQPQPLPTTKPYQMYVKGHITATYTQTPIAKSSSTKVGKYFHTRKTMTERDHETQIFTIDPVHQRMRIDNPNSQAGPEEPPYVTTLFNMPTSSPKNYNLTTATCRRGPECQGSTLIPNVGNMCASDASYSSPVKFPKTSLDLVWLGGFFQDTGPQMIIYEGQFPLVTYETVISMESYGIESDGNTTTPGGGSLLNLWDTGLGGDYATQVFWSTFADGPFHALPYQTNFSREFGMEGRNVKTEGSFSASATYHNISFLDMDQVDQLFPDATKNPLHPC